jgi:hypothetical protein
MVWFYKKLGSDNAGDFDSLAGGDGATLLRPRRGIVTRTGLHVRYFTHAVFGDGRGDDGGLADQIGDKPFAGTLGLSEDGIEKPENKHGHAQPADK